jgi:hypothetical protein
MERLIIVHWNKSTGPIPIIQYPPEGEYPPKELFLKLWAQHELNKENTLVEIESIIDGKETRVMSIIQDYEGEIYFFVLIINLDETIDDQISPDILVIIGKNLLELINTNKITRAISEAFNTIRNYSKLEGEDLINFFQDKLKFTILQILRNGVISKNELTEVLRHDYAFSTSNIDLLLITFLREKLIVKNIIPGSKECYFLIKDLSCARIPPTSIIEGIEDEKVMKKLKKEFVKFYGKYDFTQEIESKDIINFLVDKDIYNLIKALRKGNVTVNDCLTLLNNKEELFDELFEKKIIFEARGIVYLFSDIRFIKFTPYYLIETLSSRYQNMEISINQYLTHLKLLLDPLKNSNSLTDYIII